MNRTRSQAADSAPSRARSTTSAQDAARRRKGKSPDSGPRHNGPSRPSGRASGPSQGQSAAKPKSSRRDETEFKQNKQTDCPKREAADPKPPARGRSTRKVRDSPSPSPSRSPSPRGRSSAPRPPSGRRSVSPLHAPSATSVPRPVSAPKTASPPVSPKEIVDKWYKNFKIRISEKIEDKIRPTGLPYQTVPDNLDGVNPHGVLAAFRVAATVWGIYRLWSKGCRFVDLLWGSHRDETVIASLNTALTKAGFFGDILVVNRVHGHVIPLDVDRRPNVGLTRGAVGALVMDVYQCGDRFNPQSLTPVHLASLGYEHIVWIGHPFLGFYGAIDTAVWVREGAHIKWQPDAVNPMYPPHLPADSMHSMGSTGSVAWAIKHTWNLANRVVYHAVVFEPSTIEASFSLSCHTTHGTMTLEIPDHAAVKNALEKFKLRWLLSDLINYGLEKFPLMQDFLPRKVVKLNQAHYGALQEFLAGKSMNFYVFSIAYAKAVTLMDADPVVRAVKAVFPHFFENYALDLTVAAITANIRDRATLMSSVQASYAPDMVTLNSALRNIDTPTAPTPLSGLKVLLLFLAGAAFLYSRKRAYSGTLASFDVHQLVATAQQTVVDIATRVETNWLITHHARQLFRSAWSPLAKLQEFIVVAKMRSHPVETTQLLKRACQVISHINPEMKESKVLRQATRDLARMRTEEFVGDVMITPVVEELVKRVAGPRWKTPLSVALAFFDCIALQDDPIAGLMRTAIHACLHRTLAEMPLGQAIISHMSYNLVVGYVMPYFRTGVFSQLSTGIVTWCLKRSKFLTGLGLGALVVLTYCGLARMLSGRGALKQLKTPHPLVSHIREIGEETKRSTRRRPATRRQHSEIEDMTMQFEDLSVKRNRLMEAKEELSLVPSNFPIAPMKLEANACSMDRFLAEQAFVPAAQCGDLARPIRALWIKVVDNIPNEEPDTPADLGYYQWFSQPVPLYRPRVSNTNLKAMVYNRLTRDVPTVDADEWRVATLLVLHRASTGTTPRFLDSRGSWPLQDYETGDVVDDHNLDAKVYGNLRVFSHLALQTLADNELLLDGYDCDDLDRITDLNQVMLSFEDTAMEYMGQSPAIYQKHVICSCPEAQTTAWLFTASWEERFQEWLKHVDQSKRPRYVSAAKSLKDQFLTHLDKEVNMVQVNIKHDEVLIKYPDTGVLEYPNLTKKTFIPRPIHNVDPKVTVQVGVELYPVVEYFKSHFQFALLAYQDRYPVTGTMGAGLTSEELSCWYAVATRSPGWHLLVAGDDSLVVFTVEPVRSLQCEHTPDSMECYFFEGDLSQCDHTNGGAALLNEYTILRAFGLNRTTIKILYANSSANLLVGLRNKPGEHIKIHRGPERNTGGTDTTIGNTCTVLTALLYAILSTSDEVAKLREQTGVTCICPNHVTLGSEDFVTVMVLGLSEHFAKLGLDLKVRGCAVKTDDFSSSTMLPTFLKGVWYPIEPLSALNCCPAYQEIFLTRPYLKVPDVWTRLWGPLPSRLLKLGKTFRDPRDLYRVDNLDIALDWYSHAMAQSVYQFVWPPAIKRWLSRLQPADPETTGTKAAKLSAETMFHGDLYGLRVTTPFTLPHVVKEAESTLEIAKHYGVSPDELTDFFDKLQDLRALMHYEHPVWWALTRDYA